MVLRGVPVVTTWGSHDPLRPQPVRRMMCTPLSVSTMPDISPILKPLVASSNGFMCRQGGIPVVHERGDARRGKIEK